MVPDVTSFISNQLLDQSCMCGDLPNKFGKCRVLFGGGLAKHVHTHKAAAVTGLPSFVCPIVNSSVLVHLCLTFHLI